jgi:hypothetical protein
MTAVAALHPDRWQVTAKRMVLLALFVLAVTARLVQVTGALHRLESGQEASQLTYLPRFTEIAASEGRPYRDFPVEYPPVSLGAIELIGGEDANQTGVGLIWLMVVCDVVTAAALGLAWGRRASVAYLVLTVPLLGFLYLTIDLLPTALTTVAVALAVRGRERSGGLAMAAAVLAKVWPLVLMPLLLTQRKAKAMAWSIAGLAIGMVLWVGWGGSAGPLQVATQRHTPGWEYQSLVGSVWWAITGSPLRTVNDSTRLGVAPGWAKAVLLVAAFAGSAAVWRRAWHDHSSEIGSPSLAALSILLLAAPLLSHPYIIWLAPWAAIAWIERRGSVRILTAAAVLVTGLVVVSYATEPTAMALWSVKLLLLVRNGLLVAIPIAYFLERSPRPALAAEPVPAIAG